MGRPSGTLLRPPPADPNKAQIENALEVAELGEGSNIFTNRREAWQPQGARGIYGGSVIAMCLAAAQKTVPDDFIVHSYHCYFLLAGSSELPILFHVERVRDGRSFATRTVQARQQSRCIFTTTMSFAREGSGGAPEHTVTHQYPMPRTPAGGIPQPPPDDYVDEPGIAFDNNGPLQHYRSVIANCDSPHPNERKLHQWARARGIIQGGLQAHLNALAYLSDSYFIGTAAKANKLWLYPFKPREQADLLPEVLADIARYNEWNGMGSSLDEYRDRPQLGMMVSLDHTIYFHAPRKVRADEWMFREMESWWTGDGRGVVLQRIYTKDGTLLATCVQEGVVRLKEPKKKDEAKPKL